MEVFTVCFQLCVFHMTLHENNAACVSLSGCITDIQQRNLSEQASYIYTSEAAVLAEIKAAPLCLFMVALKAR